MHKCGIIHGDIKGENILVSSQNTALLSDLGLSRLEEVPTSIGLKGAGTAPWQSPEVLMGSSKSYKSDIYAFGMTIYEVKGSIYLQCCSTLTGSQVLADKRPFAEYGVGPMVVAVVVRNERPRRILPSGAHGETYDWLWAVAEQCWHTQPQIRPHAQELVDYLDPHRKSAYIPRKGSGGAKSAFFF